ncbi:MAG TPA: outer membrane protein transport protein [Bryobacteraceae bacterium]|jgi:long-chain fatty acid transport protein|nr:outer membrane protein transport protein [Bryobacteraceae bacterium]
MIVAASLCYGSAFSVSELGARAAGMGNAFIATADDGSALFYNPAGIAFQPGTHLQMDSTVVVGLFRFTPSATPVGQVVPPNGYSQSIKPHFIPLAFLYATKQISPKMTVGFGIFTPFGLSANSTNFNDGDPNLTKFVGRFAGTRVRLESFWFQPTLAYKLKDNLSIAIAPTFVHTHLELEESILNPLDPNGALSFGRTAAPTVLPGLPVNQAAAIIARLLPEGRSRIAGTANAPAVAAGLLWKNAKFKTNIGLMYRSSVVNHLSGKASFAFGNQPYALEQYVGPQFLPNAFPNQNITGSFPMPATYGVGFTNSSFWKTTLAFDVRMQDYKKFKNVPLDFPINKQLPGDKNLGLDPEKILNFNFRESWNFAVGAERPLNAKTTVRVGYQFDVSPVVAESVGPLFPDSDRSSFTVGATRKAGNKEFTFFYEAMKFLDNQTNVPANNFQWTNGDYHNFAHVAGLGLRFDMTDFSLKRKH